MINLNLFGGPGLGKSTTAAGLFHELKKSGAKVEYITEYAKDLVFSKDFYRLKDQTYILAKQHHPLFKLQDQVDMLIHDGPFLLGLVYLQEKPGFPTKEFKNYLLSLWNSYEHVNIFLVRNTDEHEYQEYGREQTLSEAQILDEQIMDMLDKNGIPYHKVDVGEHTVKHILEILVGRRD